MVFLYNKKTSMFPVFVIFYKIYLNYFADFMFCNLIELNILNKRIFNPSGYVLQDMGQTETRRPFFKFVFFSYYSISGVAVFQVPA